MTVRRASLFLLALLLAVPAAAKRRAVTPANPDHCSTGRLAIGAYTVLVARDSQFVYWLDDVGYLSRVPLRGGEVEELAQLDEEDFWLSMAVDDTNVYIGVLPPEAVVSPQPGSILAVPKTGGVPGTFVSGVATPFDLEVDATHLYWAAAGTLTILGGGGPADDGKIERIRKDGTNRQVLADDVSAPLTLALDGDRVWFGQTGLADGNETVGLFTVARSGGAVQLISDEVLPVEIALTASNVLVYGATEDVETGLFAVARDGASVRTLAEDDFILGGLEVAGDRLYYVSENDGAHSVSWVAENGGASTLVTDQLYYTEDYVVDGCAVIVGTHNGVLERVLR